MRSVKALLGCAGLLGILLGAPTAMAQCEGIWWAYAAPFLTIHHDAQDVYNCAVFQFTHEVVLEGDVLLVREHAITAGFADCLCPYVTEVVVGGLPPGAYTLRFEYGEAESDQPPAWWTWCEMPLAIPGASREDPDVLIVNASAAGCGITAVPETELPGAATWGALKVLYHRGGAR